MAPVRLRELMNIWEKLKTETIYIIRADNELYVEKPEASMDLYTEAKEAVLRVFLSMEEAQLYCAVVSHYENTEDLEISMIDLKTLFSLVDKLKVKDYDNVRLDVRVDVSSIQSESQPQSLEVIYCSNQFVN